jgi:uncharacterized SAM-binding protein YcdF (DUF218 family)
VFHVISTLQATVLSPTGLLSALLVCGLAVSFTRSLRTFGRRTVMFAGGLLAGLALLPIGDWMLQPLENRFPEATAPQGAVTGVILLGGSLKVDPDGTPASAIPSEAFSRVTTAADLARRYPEAKILVTGGPIKPRTGFSEADAVAAYLARLGVSPRRILLERRSIDTFENARFSADLVRPRPGEHWLLVTSAYHMPRAVGAFRAAGFPVTAAPTDWRSSGSLGRSLVGGSANLTRVDMVAREYLALAAYYVSGRTREFLPSP